MEKKDELSPGKQPTSRCEMMKLAGEVLEGIPHDLTHADVEYWRSNKPELHRKLRKLLFCDCLPEEMALAEWQRAYGPAIGVMFASLKGINLDGRPKDFERLVAVHRTMSLVAIGGLYAQAGIGLKFRDITAEDMEDARHRRYGGLIGCRPYALWTREAQDPEMIGISAYEISHLETPFMNLPEFLLLFWRHWQDTGLPFSADFTTILPDTHFKGGSSPCVHWTGSHLEIGRVPHNFKGSKSCGVRQICPVI